MKLCGFEAALDQPLFLIAGTPGLGGAQRLGRAGREWGLRSEALPS